MEEIAAKTPLRDLVGMLTSRRVTYGVVVETSSTGTALRLVGMFFNDLHDALYALFRRGTFIISWLIVGKVHGFPNEVVLFGNTECLQHSPDKPLEETTTCMQATMWVTGPESSRASRRIEGLANLLDMVLKNLDNLHEAINRNAIPTELGVVGSDVRVEQKFGLRVVLVSMCKSHDEICNLFSRSLGGEVELYDLLRSSACNVD